MSDKIIDSKETVVEELKNDLNSLVDLYDDIRYKISLVYHIRLAKAFIGMKYYEARIDNSKIQNTKIVPMNFLISTANRFSKDFDIKEEFRLYNPIREHKALDALNYMYITNSLQLAGEGRAFNSMPPIEYWKNYVSSEIRNPIVEQINKSVEQHKKRNTKLYT